MTSDELALARDVAARAGELLVDIRTRAGVVAPDDKEALKELRDRADRESNNLITAALVMADGDALLSEEGVDDEGRLTAGRVWIVDPLDGAWEYGQGRTDFGVHIALWDMARKEMVLGVVDLPALGLVVPPATSTRSFRCSPVIGPCGSSRLAPPAELDAICARLADRIGQDVAVVNVGSVGAKVNEILSGRAEAYLHDTGFYEWDLAAPLAVAKHYGLVCDHWDGSEVDFNLMPPFVRNVFVSHPAIAEDLRASLTG